MVAIRALLLGRIAFSPQFLHNFPLFIVFDAGGGDGGMCVCVCVRMLFYQTCPGNVFQIEFKITFLIFPSRQAEPPPRVVNMDKKLGPEGPSAEGCEVKPHRCLFAADTTRTIALWGR